MTTRQELAEALTGIDGYHISAYYRQTTKPGDGFITITDLTRDTSGIGWMETWQIIIILGQDLNAAERRFENDIDTLVDTTSTILHVANVTLATLTLDTHTLSAVIIDGRIGH